MNMTGQSFQDVHHLCPVVGWILHIPARRSIWLHQAKYSQRERHIVLISPDYGGKGRKWLHSYTQLNVCHIQVGGLMVFNRETPQHFISQDVLLTVPDWNMTELMVLSYNGIKYKWPPSTSVTSLESPDPIMSHFKGNIPNLQTPWKDPPPSQYNISISMCAHNLSGTKLTCGALGELLSYWKPIFYCLFSLSSRRETLKTEAEREKAPGGPRLGGYMLSSLGFWKDRL